MTTVSTNISDSNLVEILLGLDEVKVFLTAGLLVQLVNNLPKVHRHQNFLKVDEIKPRVRRANQWFMI